ncbi:hypothetical protein [Shinella sp. DD12]|uniref:hypothetical protein n=1 Tax=Shinella sp. DD12 TaxID=1410620 RepID=UPI0003C5509E|nr:hypothetical protein [Shinella sp. DD12]EYR79996.1 hypothetical protein SHLA_1c001760 [Shinella sp. DD12]
MFEPWIGNQWNSPRNYFGGKRILVLGESHYCSHDEPELIGNSQPNFTIYVVETWAIKNRNRFFTGITQVLSGRKRWQLAPAEIENLWSSIAFFNYVPVFVADRPRNRPTAEMFQQGRARFADFVDREKPEIIIVCGYALWWHVMKGLSNQAPAEPHTLPSHAIGSSTAIRMKHPSAGFSSDEWHRVFAQHFGALAS